jgi:ADP-heptose:LPS heptosyltransferase
VRDRGCRAVLTGVESERSLVAGILDEAGVPALSLAGRLKLGELAALIEASPLLISNNSGPIHLAAALGTPVVDIYAQTNPQHTPWMVAHRVLSRDVPCKYCYRSECPEGHHDCLRSIEPEEVVSAAIELLDETRSAFDAKSRSAVQAFRTTSLPAASILE